MKFSFRRGRSLGDGNSENRIADALGPGSGKGLARCGGGGSNGEPHRCGGRPAAMADEKDRMAGGAGPAMQPPRCGQVQPPGANFHNDRAKSRCGGGLFGDPQQISQPGRFGVEQGLRRKAERLGHARQIGPPGLACRLAGQQPQERPLRAQQPQAQAERKGGACGGKGCAGDFGEGSQRQAAAKGGVKSRCAGGQAALKPPPENDAAVRRCAR